MLRIARALAFIGFIAGSPCAQAGPESPPLAPPGRLIDVGGWRLHLHCMGDSRRRGPTVILESGLGDFSVEWSLVQPRVARFARVCSYDRGGDGWSELGPHPRTMHQLVYELHTLLARAGETPPFILAGHSYGAVLVRQYAATYPAHVAGLVLIDGGDDDPLRMLANGTLVHASAMARGDTIPAVKTSGPLRENDIPPPAMEQIRAGLADARSHANDPPRDRLPPPAQLMRALALGTVKHVAAAVNPFDNEELAALRAERAGNRYPLGDRPLIVLARGRVDSEGPQSATVEAAHRQGLTQLATFSRRGRLIVVSRSGHHVHLEQPQVVVNAIRDVVHACR